MSILFRLELAGLPPTVNQMYRTGRNGMRYKRLYVSNWQEETAVKIREAWDKEAYTGKVGVYIVLGFKGNRRWDIDNRLKALLDCLELGGVIRDDSQIWGIDVRKERGEKDKVELQMMEYEMANDK